MSDFLDQQAATFAEMEERLVAQQGELVEQLAGVVKQITRVRAARQALELPKPKSSPPTRRDTSQAAREKVKADNAKRIKQWARKHGDGWFMITDVAGEMQISPQKLAPTMNKLVRDGWLERIIPDNRRNPPSYRHAPKQS